MVGAPVASQPMQPRVVTGQLVSQREQTSERRWPSTKARSGAPPHDGQTGRCQLSSENLWVTTRAFDWRIAPATTDAARCASRWAETFGAVSPAAHAIASDRAS